MRRLLILLSAAAMLAACSSNTPRLPAASGRAATTPGSSPAAASAAIAEATPVWTEACTPTTPSSDGAGWVTVAPQGEGFSVLMPGQPMHGTSTTDTPLGPAGYATWIYYDGCLRWYTLSVITFAQGQLTASPGLVLDQTVQDALASTPNGRIVSQSDVTVNGHPGRRYTLAGTNPEDNVSAETVVAGDTILTLTLDCGRNYNRPPEGVTEAFLASLTLTD